MENPTCVGAVPGRGYFLGHSGAVGPADADLGAPLRKFILGYLVTQGQVCPSLPKALCPKLWPHAHRQACLLVASLMTLGSD